MKIVVRIPNWIGDAMLSFPSLKSLRNNFPQAQIWLAAREWIQGLLTPLDFIHDTVSLPELNNLKNIMETAKKIKENNFDLGLLLTNSFSSAFLFYLAKIPQRWGYAQDFRNMLLTKGVVPKSQDGSSCHQIKYYLNLISSLGLRASAPELSFPLSQEEINWAKQKLASLGYESTKSLAIISPGASYGPAKRWPGSNFASLASMLQEREKTEILIIGSSEEKELAESIISSMKKPPINMSGKTTLRQVAALIHQSHLFITNDSGPMHIANALRVPVIAIFGPTNPQVTAPFHQPSTYIQKEVPCWPCSYRKCPYDHRCMMKIHPEEVYQECQKYLR